MSVAACLLEKLHENSMHKRYIVFVSTMEGYPWGGSEELWSQTALNLVAQGFAVTASVAGWSPLHDRAKALITGGVDVQPRRSRVPVLDTGLA